MHCKQHLNEYKVASNGFISTKNVRVMTDGNNLPYTEGRQSVNQSTNTMPQLQQCYLGISEKRYHIVSDIVL